MGHTRREPTSERLGEHRESLSRLLGLDPQLVSRAIELKHKDMLELMEQRGDATHNFGARFLEKIVSLAGCRVLTACSVVGPAVPAR